MRRRLPVNRTVALSITLVHGTWGRGFFPPRQSPAPRKSQGKSRWFEPGSNFRRSLEAAIGSDAPEHAASIDCFEWSGANSFIERATAADALAERLDAQAAANPGLTQMLIGHSHGGSVCMLACVRMNTARPHIVTLATPFIELDASDAGTKTVADLCADQIRCLSLMIFFFLIGQPGIAALTSWIPLAWLHPWWVSYLLALPLAYLGLDAWNHWSKTRLDPNWAVGAMMQRHASTRMLVLRGVDDEATLALTAAAIATRLSQPFPFLAMLALYTALFALVLIYAGGVNLTHVDADLVRLTVLRWLPAVWLLDVVTGLLMATSGRELALWFHGLQIRSHSSPDHGHHLSVFTLPYRGRRGLLRHGLYDHSLAPSLILAWMRNDFELSPTDLDVKVASDGRIEVVLLEKAPNA